MLLLITQISTVWLPGGWVTGDRRGGVATPTDTKEALNNYEYSQSYHEDIVEIYNEESKSYPRSNHRWKE